MKSPFPGMDPYIEASGLWEDFHQGLNGKIVEARPWPPGELCRPLGCASMSFWSRPRARRTTSSRVMSGSPRKEQAGPLQSKRVPWPLRSRPRKPSRWDAAFIAIEYRETFVEIYELQPERRLVTCIEVLSPSNKRPNTPGWDLYRPNARDCCSEKQAWWRSTSCAGGLACRCSTPGRKVPTPCLSLAGSASLPVVSGRPLFSGRCHRSRCRSPPRSGCYSGTPASD